jgi:release factor glutamine methyltransferase
VSDSGSNLDQSSLCQPERGLVVAGLDLWSWLQIARQSAIAATHIDPIEADWLLQELTPLSALELRLGSFKSRSHIPIERSLIDLDNLWQQRLQHQVPIQYLAGRTPWRNFFLQVSPAVLIPRPETELIIDLAKAMVEADGRWQEAKSKKITVETQSIPSIKSEDVYHWADLGTGSGAIALGLAVAFPAAKIHAVDQSGEALAIARANAEAYNLHSQIDFYQGNWFTPLQHLKGNLRGVVSNPPYIPSQTVPTLQPEVRCHEPHLALDGGSDGLDCIRHLVETAPDFLQPGGFWLIEMMAGQADAIVKLLEHNRHYTAIAVHNDLAGIERFVTAQRI